MALRVGHNDDDALVIPMPFAGSSPTEGADQIDCLVDVVDRDIEMDTVLTRLWFRDRLEDEPRLGITAMTEIYPSPYGRTWFAIEQRTPELCDSLRFEAVKGDTGPEVGYFATLRPSFWLSQDPWRRRLDAMDPPPRIGGSAPR